MGFVCGGCLRWWVPFAAVVTPLVGFGHRHWYLCFGGWGGFEGAVGFVGLITQSCGFFGLCSGSARLWLVWWGYGWVGRWL